MRITRALSAGLAVAAIAFGMVARADTFDDAVNLYLKGVDHCSAAKTALGSGNIAKARSEFTEYEQIRDQAVVLDKTIIDSNKRDMDGNLKYCNRVGNDISVAEGTPILEEGFAACDQAIESLKARKIDDAKQQYQSYVDKRDQALKIAPGLSDIFSLRSEMRHCERMERKISHFSQMQAAITLSMESALDESETFQTTCSSSLDELKKSPLNQAAIDTAKRAVTKLLGHQKSAISDFRTYSEQSKGAATPEKQKIESNMSKGEACLRQFRDSITKQQRELDTAMGQLNGYSDSLNKANRSCSKVTAVNANKVSQAQYDKAKSEFESARRTRNQVKSALTNNRYFNDHGEWPVVREVTNRMATLNQCLDQSGRHMNALLGALAPPTPAVPAAPVPTPKAKVAAAKPSAETKPSTPQPTGDIANKVQATFTSTAVAPDLVLLYWLDGASKDELDEVKVFPTGFGKKLYVVNSNSEMRIRNQDFASHIVSVSIENINFSQKIASIGSHQVRNASINWPDNTLAIMHCEQDRISPSYIANIDSSSYVTGSFTGDAKDVELSLANPKKVSKGYLVIPDADPLPFTLYQGQTLDLPVTQGKVVVGHVKLQGQ